MRNQKLSVHLQNFPDVSFIDDNQQLVADMDIIRDICTTVLFIRDQKNLRVRLPLNKITIFNYSSQNDSIKNIQNNESYQDLIKDEVNVKNIEIVEISDKDKAVAELKLQINFKKVGVKLGARMKEISKEVLLGNWQKIVENGEQKIKINDVILENDEFEIKLIAKDTNFSATLSSNDCVVQLDVNITKELEEEGIARDIIRTIQQNRKEANFDVSDRINVFLYSADQKILNVIKSFDKNIKEQTLTNNILVAQGEDSLNNYTHYFENEIEDGKIKTALEIVYTISN